MATTPQQIDNWRESPSEHQNLEFKEAKNQYDFRKLCGYCVAIANENGGILLLGIADKLPRPIVGTQAFPNPLKTEQDLFDKLSFKVSVEAVCHPDGRVLVFSIPSRPKGTAYNLDGQYLMRVGERLVPMTEDQLRRIFDEKDTDWNQHTHAAALVFANLLGAWDENNEADLEIVRSLVQLSNLSYESWIASVREILQLPASPLTLKNGIWRVVDRKNLWQALASRVFDVYLKTFRKCAVKVLSECDPKFELPKEERYLAEIHDKIKQHSPELRKGLAESLALLGDQHSVLKHCSLELRQSAALLTIRDILETADWVIWGSLDSLLPILAEASPSEFLSAVQQALQRTPCPFEKLFSEESPLFSRDESGGFGATYTTGLLWALEALAWDEEQFVKVCVLLGKLAERDPGGKWLNRPAGSLNTILLPWLSQTSASVEKRKTALKTLIEDVPDVAWKLLLGLLPGQTTTSTQTHRPSWRNTIPDDWKEDMDIEEYQSQVRTIATFTIEMACREIERLEDLVGQLNSLPREAFNRIMEELSFERLSGVPETQRVELWEKLTEFVRVQKQEQRHLPEDTVPLDNERIDRIESIAARIAPQDPLRLHRWLFSHSSWSAIEYEGEWEEKEQKLSEIQCNVIHEIIGCGGMDAVFRFAEVVEVPGHVGNSLGHVADAAIDSQVLPSKLETDNQKLAQFMSSYVFRRHRANGWEWADGFDRSKWSPSQIGQFLCYLPFGQETWNRVAAWLAELEAEYWSKPSTGFYFSDDNLNYAVEKYTEHGNPIAAIRCLYNVIMKGKPLDSDMALRALSVAGVSDKPLDSGEVAHIIRALQNHPETNQDDLFRVEWLYMPLFRYSEGLMKTIGQRLASDPALFCEAIRLVFRPEGTEQSTTEPDESEKTIAMSVYRLLHEWRIPPGTQRDGTFSPDAFREWLSQVKDMCEESGHLRVAQSQIGQVLIHSPTDSDGFWLDRAVASALNGEDAQEMRNGYRMGVTNSRGAHWIDSTGTEDRELAEKQREKAEEIEAAGYHRLATTYRELAEDYEREAYRVIDRYGELAEE